MRLKSKHQELNGNVPSHDTTTVLRTVFGGGGVQGAQISHGNYIFVIHTLNDNNLNANC